MIDRYFREIQDLIYATSLITTVSFYTERRSETIGFVRGVLTFEDGSSLHFREFVRTEEDKPTERYTYVYHYQSLDGQTIFRYDNTNHYPDLGNAPHHKHVGANNVIPSQAPDLHNILREIGDQIAS